MRFLGRNPSDKSVVTCLPARLDGELLVTDEDRAILFESGAVLADLGPGRHSLSPSRIPALRVAGDLSGVQIFLVRTVPVRLPVRGTTQPVPVDGYNVIARVELEGTLDVQVTDPRLLLSSLGSGPEAGAALGEAAGQAVRVVLAAGLMRASMPLPDLCAEPPPELLEAVRAGAAEELAAHGATVTGLALSLRLDDEAQLQLAKTKPPTGVTAPPAAPAVVSTNQLAQAATAPAGACPRCGAPATGGKFCITCGAPIAIASGCPACGAPVAASAKFCSGCGTPVAAAGPPSCKGCGAELAANAKFCSTCGMKS